MIILIILIILVLLNFFFIRNKLFNSEDIVLDDVKLREESSNKGFALMLEQEDGTYIESSSSSWPTDMVFNSELSGCIDVDGNKINNALSFNSNTNAVIVRTNKTAYCYLYFDMDKEAPIVTVTINNNETKEATMTINSNEDGTYCVNTSSIVNDMNNCLFEGNIEENKNITTGIFTETNDYYVHIKDKSGNIGISEKQEIKIPNGIGNYLIDNIINGDLWKSTLEDDGYRFVGTNPNNYICFGTSDKGTCTGDTDKYMYRIIGIFDDSNGNKHAKLIKKEALNLEYAWHSDLTIDIDWNKTDLYKGLIGSYFVTNTSYPYMQNSIWTNKISTWDYTMTNITNSGPSYLRLSINAMYLHELNRNGKSTDTFYYDSGAIANLTVGEWKKLSTKISLMYASDYALSLGSSALNYTSNSNNSILKTGWMHITNNDSGAPTSNEWTMTRYRYSDDTQGEGIIVYWGGLISSGPFTIGSYVARPVFYLESDVELSSDSGNGSITNPYLIKQ